MRLARAAASRCADAPCGRERTATGNTSGAGGTVDDKRFIEPGGREAKPRSRSGTGSTTLPEDLLREQSIRIQLFYAVGVVLWLSNLVLDLYMSPHGDRGPHKLLIEGFGAALAAGLA